MANPAARRYLQCFTQDVERDTVTLRRPSQQGCSGFVEHIAVDKDAISPHNNALTLGQKNISLRKGTKREKTQKNVSSLFLFPLVKAQPDCHA